MKAWVKWLVFALYITALLAGLLLFGVHRSRNPVILGRYSAPYFIFLVAYSALIVVHVCLFFDHRCNNLRHLLPRLDPATIVKFYAFVLVFFIILMQVSLYPHPGIKWGALWLPVILVALFLSCALLSTKEWLFTIVLRLTKLLASRAMGRLVVISWSVLATLICLEIVLRLWQPNFMKNSCYVKDHDIGFRIRGDWPGTNSLGFRDEERAFEKDEGVYRILALGDSMAFTYTSLGNNYLALLESKLNGRGIEVINTGVPGYGPREELRLLKELGLKYAPDHVMVNFFMGNDFMDSKADFKERILLNGMVFDMRRFPAGILPFRQWFLHHYLKVGVKARLYYKHDAHGDEVPALRSPPPSRTEERFNLLWGSYSMLFHRSEEGRLRDGFDIVRAYLLDMKDVSERNGATFSIALIPDKIQVEPDVRRRVLEANGLDESEFDFQFPNRLFESFGNEHGIPILDLAPYFREGCGDEERFIEFDTHWSENGHRLAAEALADLWVRKGLGRGTAPVD